MPARVRQDESVHQGQVAATLQRVNQARKRLLAFTDDDGVGAIREQVVCEKRWMDSAGDHKNVRVNLTQVGKLHLRHGVVGRDNREAHDIRSKGIQALPKERIVPALHVLVENGDFMPECLKDGGEVSYTERVFPIRLFRIERLRANEQYLHGSSPRMRSMDTNTGTVQPAGGRVGCDRTSPNYCRAGNDVNPLGDNSLRKRSLFARYAADPDRYARNAPLIVAHHDGHRTIHSR